jgi:hypothetical protein
LGILWFVERKGKKQSGGFGEVLSQVSKIGRPGAPVIFQEVVHSIWTGEAGCDEQLGIFGGIEWTFIRMPDLAFAVERS